jgi:hypothetical protein
MIRFFYTTISRQPRWQVDGGIVIKPDELKEDLDFSIYTSASRRAILLVKEHLKDYPEQLI